MKYDFYQLHVDLIQFLCSLIWHSSQSWIFIEKRNMINIIFLISTWGLLLTQILM